ncbi:MAG TPA: phenylalanine--tRNA ligase subunit alpha [Candidatus Saccharimonadales bacterium]|jgi:phenylalanyl-tRNA synthetase alpha chain
MAADNLQIETVRETLLAQLKEGKGALSVLRSAEMKSLFEQLKTMPPDQRADFGKRLNDLKKEIEVYGGGVNTDINLTPIDVTAPFDVGGSDDHELLPASLGSVHPITREMDRLLDIGYRMGFKAVQSPEIDDDYHMFSSLNFPEGHPARDDFDSFLLKQTDKNSRPLVAPAHTSTMQIRVLKEDQKKLEGGQPIAYFIPGKVFRNEDLDPRHEHTFYQLEGVYVGKGVTVANLMATLKDLLSAYFEKDIELKTQPFYFPFTEPSFEFASSCPFCDKAGCRICSYSGYIELLGCGMTHPNVYLKADIDPEVYTGFAWGVGFMRLAMIKFGIDDIRYFSSGNLEFLRQFK